MYVLLVIVNSPHQIARSTYCSCFVGVLRKVMDALNCAFAIKSRIERLPLRDNEKETASCEGYVLFYYENIFRVTDLACKVFFENYDK